MEKYDENIFTTQCEKWMVGSRSFDSSSEGSNDSSHIERLHDWRSDRQTSTKLILGRFVEVCPISNEVNVAICHWTGWDELFWVFFERKFGLLREHSRRCKRFGGRKFIVRKMFHQKFQHNKVYSMKSSFELVILYRSTRLSGGFLRSLWRMFLKALLMGDGQSS